MIRTSVHCPSSPGVTFDHAYSGGAHRRRVQDRLGPLGLAAVELERGIAGFGGGPAPHVAVGHLRVPSMEVFRAAWAQAGDAIVAGVPHCTNAPRVAQISGIVPA